MRRPLFATIAFLLATLPASPATPGSLDAFYAPPSGLGALHWKGVILGTSGAVVLAIFGGPLGTASAGAIIKFTFTQFVVDTGLDYALIKVSNNSTTKAFLKENKAVATFPLPINEEGSHAYKKCLSWITKERKTLFEERDRPFDINHPEFQKILKEAAVTFAYDRLASNGHEHLVNDLTFLALLNFQTGHYEDSSRHSMEAILHAQGRQLPASLAHCLYATSRLHFSNANNNIKVQKEHLLPALLEERGNGFASIALSIYLGRLMTRIHSGESTPDELLFACDLVKDTAFSKRAAECIPVLAVCIVNELEQSQKDILTIAKIDNVGFLRRFNASLILDVRLGNFLGLKGILAELLPFEKEHDESIRKVLMRPEDPCRMDLLPTYANIERKLAKFKAMEPELRKVAAEAKNRIDGKSYLLDMQTGF